MAFYFVVALSFPVVLFVLKGCFAPEQGAADAVLKARIAKVAVAAKERQKGVDEATLLKVSEKVLEKLATSRGTATATVVPGSPTQLSGGEKEVSENPKQAPEKENSASEDKKAGS